MTTRDHQQPRTTTVDTVTPSPAAGYALGALRIIIGWTFLWAFFDKLFALGFGTGRDETGAVDRFGDAAWINGGSPTEGFLKFGADGPFTDFYHAIAGDTWTDWAFMLGLLAIGVSLTFGVFEPSWHLRRCGDVPDDVDRRSPSGEQPDHRRPHHRCGGRPGPGPARRQLLRRSGHLVEAPGHRAAVPRPSVRNMIRAAAGDAGATDRGTFTSAKPQGFHNCHEGGPT